MIKDFFKKRIGKVLLLLIVVSFILSSIGGIIFFSNKYNLIVVNGDKISYRKFANFLTREREIAYSNNANNIDYILSKDFTMETLEKMKNVELLKSYINDNNLLFDKNTTINKIISDEKFRTNGNFDSVKYNEFLKNAGIVEDEYIKSMQEFYANTFIFNMFNMNNNFSEDTIKYIIDKNNKYKIVDLYTVDKKDLKIDKVEVSDEEMKEYYNKNIKEFTHEEERKVDFIKIDLAKVEKEISDKEIEDYYNNNKNLYNLPETFDVYHIESTEKSDLEKIVKNKKDLLSSVKKVLNREESDILIKNIPIEALSYIFGSDIKDLKVGEFSKIIESNGFFMAIYLKAKNEPKIITLEEAKDDIIKTLQRNSSEENMKANYDNIQNLLAQKNSFEEIANILKSKIETLDYIKYSDTVKELKANKDKIFSITKNDFVPAFGINTDYYIYSVSDIKKSYVDKFDDVKDSILNTIKTNKENELYLSKVSIENKNKYKIQKKLLIKKDDVKFDKNFLVEIYRLKNKEFTNIYQNKDNLYFAQIIDEKDIDKNDINFIDYKRIMVLYDRQVNNFINYYFIKYLNEKYNVYINTDLLKYF